MSYQLPWKNLKIRRFVFWASWLVPLLAITISQRFRTGAWPSNLNPLGRLNPWSWFLGSLIIVAATYLWVLAFRCPRCKKKFFYLTGKNKDCANCGLQLNAEAQAVGN